MSEITQSIYSASGTDFKYVDSDNDQFDREHVSKLAKAVTEHTHADTRGNAVARVDNNVITTAMMQSGAVTDTILGNRTADPSLTPSGLSGTLTQFLGWITNRIKAITGGTNWYDAPATTLSAAATAITNSVAHIANVSNPHRNHGSADWRSRDPGPAPHRGRSQQWARC